MYKLVNVNNPKLALETSENLTTLFVALDKPEYKYKTPVIIDDKKEIVAGHESAWNWSVLKNFTLA